MGRQKLLYTAREVKCVMALASNVRDDKQKIRDYFPVAEGWHTNKDLSKKLRIEANDVPKFYGPLKKKGMIQSQKKDYFDERGRPVRDTNVYRLKREVPTWQAVYRMADLNLPILSDYTINTVAEIESLAKDRWPTCEPRLTPTKRRLLKDATLFNEVSGVLIAEMLSSARYHANLGVPIYSIPLNDGRKAVPFTVFDVIEVLKEKGGQQRTKRGL